MKTAIGFLFVSLGIGGWTITWRGVDEQFPSAYIISAHSHAILVGFVMMMILGVALWLFPRPDKNDPRHSPRQANVKYWLLAVGASCRIAGELARAANAALWLRIGFASASR
jgi:heme/copper-type cytochrome/quinol oxidase subunit 1